MMAERLRSRRGDTPSHYVLSLLEDTDCNHIPGPQENVEVTKGISTPRDLNEIPLEFSERWHDTINSVVSPPDQNMEYENHVNAIQNQSTE